MGGTENFDVKVARMLRGLKQKVHQQARSKKLLLNDIQANAGQAESKQAVLEQSKRLVTLAETLREIEKLKKRQEILEQIQDELTEEIILREVTGYDYALLMGAIILLVFLVAYTLITYSCVPLSISLPLDLKVQGFIVAQQNQFTDIAVNVTEFHSGKECPDHALELYFEVADEKTQKLQSPQSYSHTFNWNDTISFHPG